MLIGLIAIDNYMSMILSNHKEQLSAYHEDRAQSQYKDCLPMYVDIRNEDKTVVRHS